MKKIVHNSKKSFIKKLFIKLCRKLGYEIIDQNSLFIPTLNKKAAETLSVQGKKSISLPLGEVKITRRVEELGVILRTCTNVNMLTQNKKRIFEKEKIEYTLRSLNSIINSLAFAKNKLSHVNFKITIIDHNSSTEHIQKIKSLLISSNLSYDFLNLDIKEFEDKINKINAEGKKVTSNQISNMSNIHKSIALSKHFNDLIYFVEDDYLHEKEAIFEMILTYERIASQINSELIMCPADYPYLYTKIDSTEIYLGEKLHWRKISESLCTFLTSQEIIKKYEKELISMCEFEHLPFETPLHEIYKKELCVSPIPSLAIHCTNVNSVYGLSPNKDWEKIWDEN